MPGKEPSRTMPIPKDWLERQKALYTVLDSKPLYPADRFEGRGIVTCAGGKYFPPAWVMINMLRKLGCELPIEMWYLGSNEMSPAIIQAIESVPNVTLINAYRVKMDHPVRKLGGWESKPFAIINSRFKEVLFLDGDNVPVKNPEFMFEHSFYKRHGSVFWPDYQQLALDRSIWQVCNITPKKEDEFETGQILVDKSRCWLPLMLTMHMNEWSEFYYNHIWGDKDTFHMAWHVARQQYGMIPHPIFGLSRKVMCQHDPEGERLFQHRNLAKFNVHWNERIDGFMFEADCLNFIKQLNPKDFSEGMGKTMTADLERSACAGLGKDEANLIIKNKYYKLHKDGGSRQILEFNDDGTISSKGISQESFWHLGLYKGALCLVLADKNGAPLCRLNRISTSRWRGALIGNTRYAVELKRK